MVPTGLNPFKQRGEAAGSLGPGQSHDARPVLGAVAARRPGVQDRVLTGVEVTPAAFGLMIECERRCNGQRAVEVARLAQLARGLSNGGLVNQAPAQPDRLSTGCRAPRSPLAMDCRGRDDAEAQDPGVRAQRQLDD